MKKIFIISAFIIGFSGLQAQVSIGKIGVSNDSVILEFGPTASGIRFVPVADVTAMTAIPGTIAFDGATGSFRYYNGTWSAADAGGITGGAPTAADIITQGVIIGDTMTSVAEGTLILGIDSGETKVMILPKVTTTLAAPVINMIDTKTGLMVYNTTTKEVQVFNGNFWVSY